MHIIAPPRRGGVAADVSDEVPHIARRSRKAAGVGAGVPADLSDEVPHLARRSRKAAGSGHPEHCD